MKKVLTLVMIFILICTTACSNSNSGTLEEITESVESVQELSQRLGVDMSLPQAAGNVQCNLINNLIGETTFTYNGVVFVHRASKVYSGDPLYGFTDDFKQTDSFELDGSIAVTVEKNNNSHTLATWYESGNHHSLYTLKNIGTDIIKEIINEL